jgi:uncharacterized protein (DUF58 family)
LNAIAQRLNETFGRKAQAWARRRQGTDPRSSRLESRRIYILPTRAGIFYAVVVFTMLIGSMNYNNNMGFALTFLLASIGIISIYHCHRNLVDVYLHFSGSQPAFAGESVRFNFVIENQSPYSRIQLRFGHNGRQEICDTLSADGRQQVNVRIKSTRRGWLGLPRLLLSTRYPLGLFRAWAWVNMDIAEVVYPQPVSSASVALSNHSGHSTPGRRAPGDDDFSGLRTYRLGDPPKRIAWKILARSGETLITEYHGGGDDLTWINWHDYPVSDPETRLSLLTRRILDTEAAGNMWGLRLPDQVIGPDRGTTHQHQCLQTLALYDAGSGYQSS